MEGIPDFTSPAEEAAFWKEKAAELSAEIKEAKEEFTEFQVKFNMTIEWNLSFVLKSYRAVLSK